MTPEIRVVGIKGIPMVQAGDDLAGLILDAAQAEGRVVPLDTFEPSPFALDWAGRYEKDPRQVEAVLRESARIVRQVRGVMITETHQGLI
jgi:coenzyme F420-0:L-glutamate ligase/coenzyme F420-1:gamma-L-glutamate ligase